MTSSVVFDDVIVFQGPTSKYPPPDKNVKKVPIFRQTMFHISTTVYANSIYDISIERKFHRDSDYSNFKIHRYTVRLLENKT